MRDGNLRQLFRQHLPGVDFVSVETGGTGRGIPDSNYCIGGHEGWIEFKMANGWLHGLRPEQIAWIGRRARHGGRVLVAVRRKTQRLDELWILGPEDIENRSLKTCTRRLACSGGPRNWQWDQILSLMVK